MVACVSPAYSNCEHTLNTLRYADRVKEHQSNEPPPPPIPNASSSFSGPLKVTKSVISPAKVTTSSISMPQKTSPLKPSPPIAAPVSTSLSPRHKKLTKSFQKEEEEVDYTVYRSAYSASPSRVNITYKEAAAGDELRRRKSQLLSCHKQTMGDFVQVNLLFIFYAQV